MRVAGAVVVRGVGQRGTLDVPRPRKRRKGRQQMSDVETEGGGTEEKAGGCGFAERPSIVLKSTRLGKSAPGLEISYVTSLTKEPQFR